jgi:hypothetical protein
MLKRAKKRKLASTSRSPQISKEPHRNMSMVVDMHQNVHMNSEHFAHKYDTTLISSPEVMQQMHVGMIPQQTAEVDSIWRGFEMTSNEQLPVWISDQSLGGNTFSQQGMDAFLLPADYLPPAPQMW